jgi:hypothetical protein
LYLRLIFLTWLVCGLVMPLSAQDDVTNAAIAYGDTVEDTLTAESFFDLWAFYGGKGDRIRVSMTATEGLAPLIGLLDASRSLVAHSPLEAEINSTAMLEFTLPVSGEYVINATRIGNFEGTTTGSYTLTLNLVRNDETHTYQDVTFLCSSNEVTTAATFEFHPDRDTDQHYRITLFGFNGFEPVLRYQLPGDENRMICTDQVDAAGVE